MTMTIRTKGAFMLTIHTKQNIFDMPEKPFSAVCVTTNGVTKKDGHAVMGAGIAKEANTKFHVSGILGAKLRATGNHVYELATVQGNAPVPYKLVAFPTKNDWRDNSSIKRIVQSAYELMAYCVEHGIENVYLPPAGCGCGGLDWDAHVAPVLKDILDDRCIVVLRG